jgi:type III pantothenate kinase
MNPDVVVDVGNTLIKWGRCADGVLVEDRPVPPDEPATWLTVLESWFPEGLARYWIVSGVHPPRRDRLIGWLRGLGQQVRLLDDPADLPLEVNVPRPDYVGIDRLLAAVAANSRRRPGVPALVYTVGTALTANWLDEHGVYQGGAILPGLRMVARALHEQTALLPLVEVPRQVPELPARDTVTSIEAGLYWYAVGGMKAVLEHFRTQCHPNPEVYVTGGDAALLQAALGPEAAFWPTMTLEGILLAARSLA